jgi:hypothetical protein
MERQEPFRTKMGSYHGSLFVPIRGLKRLIKYTKKVSWESRSVGKGVAKLGNGLRYLPNTANISLYKKLEFSWMERSRSLGRLGNRHRQIALGRTRQMI